MGSSKKHKEKDKDREEKRHKHKKEDKDREKDRDSTTKEKKHHKHRRHRSRSRSPKDRDRDGSSKKKRSRRSPSPSEQQESNRPATASASKNEGKAVQSLTIEETNKIRAKLGLPPLKDDSSAPAKKKDTGGVSFDDPKEDSAKDGVTLEDGDVHKPAVNLRTERKAREIKEKLALIKEKRQLNKKLMKVRTLGDDSDEDSAEDAHAWIEKSRRKQEEKAKADKKAKMLAEMDEEFGIGSLVQDQMKQEKQERYNSRHLSNLRVEHSKEAFKEGRNVILTLKDGGVLDEDNDDVLVNYNIIDDEKATKNIELRKKKPDYRAYQADEYDEYGNFIPRAILDKYDEQLDGAKVKSFTLDSQGGSQYGEEARLAQLRASMQRQAQTLQTTAPQLARDYLTHQEMEGFKKTKRKRKIKRKLRGKFTVDELMPDKKTQDHGTRRRHHSDDEEEAPPAPAIPGFGGPEQPIPGLGNVFEPQKIDGSDGQTIPGLGGFDEQTTSIPGLGDLPRKGGNMNRVAMDMDVDLPDPDDQAYSKRSQDLTRDYLGPAIEDEAEAELQSLLHKARKLKQKKRRKKQEQTVEEKIAAANTQIDSEVKEEPESSSSAGDMFTSVHLGGGASSMSSASGLNIVLNSTSEFCRQLGDIPTFGASTGAEKEEEEDDDMDLEEEETTNNEVSMREEMAEDEGVQAWTNVNLDKGSDEEEEVDEQGPVLDEEPALQIGIAGALQLAVNKGYLENQPRRVTGSNRSNIESQNFIVTEKNYHDIDAKYNKHDRFRGPITDFKEKPTYKPDVKLEYIDEHGRLLNRKEAFRQLSHRFHGKGSGKMKTEKREKKWQEEEAMKKMSSTDTPLGTVAMMQAKQKQNQMPYVFLSGGAAKSLTTNSIIK